jgi:hypothetical protein
MQLLVWFDVDKANAGLVPAFVFASGNGQG